MPLHEIMIERNGFFFILNEEKNRINIYIPPKVYCLDTETFDHKISLDEFKEYIHNFDISRFDINNNSTTNVYYEKHKRYIHKED